MKKTILTLLLALTFGFGFSQQTVVIGGGTVTTTGSITSGTVTVDTGTINAGGFTALSSSTITMSVAGAYATGDYMGTSTTPQTFTNVCRSSGGSGTINGIVISDKITTANVPMELWLFSATFTAPTDNAAWAISDAEATTLIGYIDISTSNWRANSNNQVYFDGTISIPFDLPIGTSIYYALVARGTTPSLTSADLSISLVINQN